MNQQKVKPGDVVQVLRGKHQYAPGDVRERHAEQTGLWWVRIAHGTKGVRLFQESALKILPSHAKVFPKS